jgi:D-serine deaminase-like pyridoxal phosphate-dependent protein
MRTSDIGRNKYDLDTPCLVVDIDRLERNMKRLHEAAAAAGKSVRPHAKTHKCSAIARRQIEAGAVGVCAAKVAEAEALEAAGVRGVLVTGPVTTRLKMRRLVRLLRGDPALLTVVDDLESARMLNRTVLGQRLSMGVLIDVDAGLGRSGVAPEQAVELALAVDALPSLRVKGIQAYAGQVQHIPSYAERRRLSLRCMRRAARAFVAMKEAGLNAEIFSGGGTGTYDIDIGIPELTELQAGSYVLMDVEYADIGAMGRHRLGDVLKPALTLLTTVVSANQEGFVTVDAGLKSLYRHGGIPRVLVPAGRGLRYDWFGDEYGKILYSKGTPAPKPGSVIELMVSHCDPTVNLFDRFHVTRNQKVIDVWLVDLRGKSQ